MKLPSRTIPVSLASALALAGSVGRAGAQGVATDTTPARSDPAETTGPRKSLLESGAWTLGLSYLPAVVVAAQSSLPEDDNLFVPVAGPWLDYATRDCPNCSHETMNQVLLVTDGVVQGLGALQIVGSFLLIDQSPGDDRSIEPSSARRTLQIAPARLAGGYGVAARGYF